MKKVLHVVLFFLFAATGKAQIPFEIIDYRPAPGQFVDCTEFTGEGQDASELTLAQVCAELNRLCGELPFSYTVSLGSFGGSVTVKMNKPVPNRGGADFKVYGNAFYDPAYTPQLTDTPGGNSEPGIVWVSRDDNGNGIADDTWYELAGSEYGNTASIGNYVITYYEPDSLASDIFWKDNQGDSGYVYRNDFHMQASYYPFWIGRDSLVYRGRRLPDNARLMEKTSGRKQWVLFSYPWGYADNHPNNSALSDMDIDWAVDSLGRSVVLDRVDFIRVVNAVNQHLDLGVGEVSTEFAGIAPLQDDVSVGDLPEARPIRHVFPNPCGNHVRVEISSGKPGRSGVLELLDLSGRILERYPVSGGGYFRLDMQHRMPGVYLLRYAGTVSKVIKR